MAGGALSMMYTKEPTSWPPTDSPCSRRTAVSSTGAHTPAVSYVGRHPSRNVGSAISRIDTVSAFLRPVRSPTCPNSTPPTGRMKNAPAKTPNAPSSDAVLDSAGKNSDPNSSAKYPNTAKSYHSSTFPSAAAKLTSAPPLVCCACRRSSASSSMAIARAYSGLVVPPGEEGAFARAAQAAEVVSSPPPPALPPPSTKPSDDTAPLD